MFALSSLLMLLGVAVDVAVAQQAVREFLVPNGTSPHHHHPQSRSLF